MSGDAFSLVTEGSRWADLGYLQVEIEVITRGRDLRVSLADDLTMVRSELWTPATLRLFDLAVSKMRAALVADPNPDAGAIVRMRSER